MFSNKLYNQIEGVDMGYPFCPDLAKIFMFIFENKWLKDFPHGLKPVFYKWYVDDIFALLACLNFLM